jgi:biopolymer transport protein ExbD
VETKICTECKIELPIERFPKSKRKSSLEIVIYINSKCKECKNALARTRYPALKEKLKETHKLYYKNNKEKMRIQGNNYYKNNSEKVIAKQREYQKCNKEKVKAAKNISYNKMIKILKNLNYEN